MANILDLSTELLIEIWRWYLYLVLCSYEPRTMSAQLPDNLVIDGYHNLEDPPPCLSSLPDSEVDGSPALERVCHPQPDALSGCTRTCTFAPVRTPREISHPFPLHDACRTTRAASNTSLDVWYNMKYEYPCLYCVGQPRPVTTTECPSNIIASKPLCSCVLAHIVQSALRCRVLDISLPGRGGEAPKRILSALRTADECFLEHLALRFNAWTLVHREIRPETLRAPMIRSSRTLNSSFIAVGPRLTVLHVAAQTHQLRFPLNEICAILLEAPELVEVVFQSALKGPASSSPDKIILPHLKHFYLQDSSECWRLLRQTLDVPESCPSVHIELISSPAQKACDMDSWNELCHTFRADNLIPPFHPSVGIVDIIRDSLDTNDVEISDYRWPELLRFTVSETYDGALATTDCRSSEARWSIAIRNGLIVPSGTASRERRAQFETPAIHRHMKGLIRAMPASASVAVFSIRSHLQCYHLDIPQHWGPLLERMENLTTIIVPGIDGNIVSRYGPLLRLVCTGAAYVYGWREEKRYPEVAQRIAEVILPDWAQIEEPQSFWDNHYARRRPSHFSPIRLARTRGTTP